MQEVNLDHIADGFVFGEAPRWHKGRLWISDQVDKKIYSMGADNKLTVEHQLDFNPSGLGWLPNGDLLIVSMFNHKLMKDVGSGEFAVFADLASYCGGKANDMVVDKLGRAYVGNIGFDDTAYLKHDSENGPFPKPPTVLVRVDPDGSSRVVAENLHCPNGMAITGDGKTLVVGQSGSNEILGFMIDKNGDLSGCHVYALLPERPEVPMGFATPDGLCLDEQGAAWVASPISMEFLRVEAGTDNITHRIDLDNRYAIACVLGGANRKTLYAISCWTVSHERAPEHRDGRLGAFEVEVAGGEVLP